MNPSHDHQLFYPKTHRKGWRWLLAIWSLALSHPLYLSLTLSPCEHISHFILPQKMGIVLKEKLLLRVLFSVILKSLFVLTFNSLNSLLLKLQNIISLSLFLSAHFSLSLSYVSRLLPFQEIKTYRVGVQNLKKQKGNKSFPPRSAN